MLKADSAFLSSIPSAILPIISQARIAGEVAATFNGLISVDQVPFLEDLVNASSLIDFASWRLSEGHSLEELCPPCYAVNEFKSKAYISAGRQAGVADSKLAIDPLINERSDPREHFNQALDLAWHGILPWDTEAPIDKDMRFAINGTLDLTDGLFGYRKSVMATLNSIKQRCIPMTRLLIGKQDHTVNLAANQVDMV